MKKKALFSFSVFSFYREMYPVAEFFVRQEWEVHAVFAWSGPTAIEAMEDCRKAGISVHLVPEAASYGDHLKLPPLEKTAQQAKAQRTGALKRLVSVPHILWQMVTTRRYAFGLMNHIRPNVTFGSSFNSSGRIDNGIARACKRLRILYCCIPFSPYTGDRNNLEGRFNNYNMKMVDQKVRSDYDLINRLMYRFFPHWTRTRNDTTIFYWDPLVMFCGWATGMMSKEPWNRPSEYYDFVFVDSDFSRRMLVEGSVDPAKVLVSGSPLLDEVMRRTATRAFYERFCAENGLRAGEQFLLLNVEPSVEHRYATSEEHWSRLTSVFKSVSRSGMPVIVSLHPLCDLSNYEFIEKKYGFRILRGTKIHEAYPYCSVVVSFPCSTNLLAERFGKPLIIYDFLGITKEGVPRCDLFRMSGAEYAYEAEMIPPLIDRARRNSHASAIETDAKHLACETIFKTVLEHCSV